MKKIEKWIRLEKWEKTVAERPEVRMSVSGRRVYLSPLPSYVSFLSSNSTAKPPSVPSGCLAPVLDLIKIQFLTVHPIPTKDFKGIPRSTSVWLTRDSAPCL